MIIKNNNTNTWSLKRMNKIDFSSYSVVMMKPGANWPRIIISSIRITP